MPERLRGVRRDPRTARLSEVIDDWQRARRRLGDAPGTEVAYQWALSRFLRFANQQDLDLVREIEPEDIEAFQDMLAGEGLARQSQRLAATALRELFKWAAARRLVPAELHLAVTRIRVPRTQPKPLDERDLMRLLFYLLPARPEMSEVAARDRALFLYLLGTTARVSEVLQVSRRDYEKAWVVQKGGGNQLLLAPPIVTAAVDDYLRLRKDDSPWLWVTYDSNRPRRRITREGVLEIWKRMAQRFGVKPFTTHEIRHTASTILLDQGVQEAIIAAQMGHTDLSTLAGYAKLRPGRRQKALDAMQTFLEETIQAANRRASAKGRTDDESIDPKGSRHPNAGAS